MARTESAPFIDRVILRAEGLQGPYYGLHPLNNVSQNTSELVDDLRKEFLSISVLVNAGAPVNKLPHEILLMVFLSLQATSGEDAPPDWTAVLLVCRRWFVVAATAPHFWRTLVVGKSLNLLRTGLVRSKGFSIDVSIIKRDAVPETARTILPHLHRLHSLSIRSIHQRHKGYVSQLMQHPMLVLVHLKAIVELPISWVVNAENPSLTIRSLPLTVDKFPQLRSMRVDKIFVPPGPEAVYKQLTTLHLWGPQTRDYNTVVAILRSCINVEDLALELEETAVDLNMAKVVLPKLRNLDLRGWRWFLHDILQTIAIPPTVDLSIHLGGPEDDVALREQSILAVLPPNHETVLPIFACVNKVHAQAREAEDILVAHAPAGGSQSECRRLSLRMPVLHRKRSDPHDHPFVALGGGDEPQEPENPREVARSLRHLSVFSAAPVETLQIDIEWKKVNCVDWRAVFSHFPLLRVLEITVQGHPPKPSAVLFALAPPIPATSNNTEIDDSDETEPAPEPEPVSESATGDPITPPCPHIRVIRMHRFRATADPHDRWFPNTMDISTDVSWSLGKRRDAGCDALEELVLDLDCMDAQEWSAVNGRRAACESALESLVGKLEYEERENWRDVFAYKD